MEVKVEEFRGDRNLARGVERMTNLGWTVEDQTSRKALYSLMMGLFTRKQIYTVTFVKP
jgi:hypothetical protein